MPKFFISQEQIDGNNLKIKGKDVNHIRNVLRKKINDEITVCNIDNQKDYLCTINELEKEYINCTIVTELEKNVESNVKLTILQGLPKADKMELIIQKSVELGVTEIIPIEMKRCVVKLQEKDKIKKVQRWQKISEVASKQCGRNIIPKIGKIVMFFIIPLQHWIHSLTNSHYQIQIIDFYILWKFYHNLLSLHASCCHSFYK